MVRLPRLRRLTPDPRAPRREQRTDPSRRSALRAARRLLLAAPVALLAASGAQAFNPQPEPPAILLYPVVSITDTQTLSINVTHFHARGGGHDSGRSSPTLPIGIVLLSANGEVLQTTVLNVAEDGSSFLDLDGAELWAKRPDLFLGGRASLRVEIELFPPDPIHLDPGAAVSGVVPCFVPTSLEIFDHATARTTGILQHPLVLKGFNPQPEPPAR